MRRYYNQEESDIRIKNYTASYARANVEFRPNLCLTSAYPIFRKRQDRIYRLHEKESEYDNRQPIEPEDRAKNPALEV
jgi:hypothetical protein